MEQLLTILLVEDDSAVRGVLSEALTVRGFRVLAADNGQEALRLLDQEPIDVLLADVVMPELNGIELAKQAKLLHPEIRIILATGYLSRAKEAMSVGKLLFKPLRADDIEAEIREGERPETDAAKRPDE